MDGLLSAAIIVLADDLIWSTRITEAIRRAGGTAVSLAGDDELRVALEAEAVGDEATVGGAVIDLGGRRYDGVAAIERVSAARLPVIAVSQHDDEVTRKRALNAGAIRVFSYQKFFQDGTALVGKWLGGATRAPE